MLKRKLMSNLIKWNEEQNRKCLIIEGARQTGKTYLINEFLAQEFSQEYIISIDFLRSPEFIDIFEHSLDPEYLIKMIKLQFIGLGKIFDSNKTIIFFDEIQACPNAITSLKYFYQDSKYKVISSGSLLGLGYQKVKSFPVGAVERLTLYPLDFEEFLWSLNVDVSYIEAIKECFLKKIPVINELHNKMNEIFFQYICVGGMPSVVNAYILTKDLSLVLLKQKEILNDYRNDIAKYCDSASIKNKTRECFDSIKNQLYKINKKFKYSTIKHGARSIHYEECLNWLLDAGIIIKVNNLNALTNSLSFEEDFSSFKIYLNDWSLLYPMFEEYSLHELYNNELALYKGGIYENVIASTLHIKNYKLFYYSPNENIENEFIFSKENGIYLLEVKASNSTKSSSFNKSLRNTDYYGVKITKNNLSFNDRILCIPHYMAFLL
jgi:predicted AAA+ superfamily ATPase